MKCDVIGPRYVQIKQERLATHNSGHLLYHSEANNGQAGVRILINNKWKDNITRVTTGNSRLTELVLHLTYIYTN